jgi:hypothetical protein
MTATFRLRGYTVERLLGRGGSGEVWQARVSSSGARVALKRIPTASEEQRARARAEAALLSALEHPNLVRLHSMVPAGDALVLVLDLADGGSLAQLLAARGRLTPGEVITAVAPVAAALDYLHGEGVVHGDVSAANILFTAAGAPLLADVGVARLVGDDGEPAATAPYVDPAVAAGGLPGAPSDVFSLAGVALHALTGEPPWPATEGATALERAAGGDLGDVTGRLTAAGVPPAMAAVLTRALALDPRRRGTAADLALDLRHSAAPTAVEFTAGRAGGGGAGGAQAGAAKPAGAWSGPRHAARPIAAAVGGAVRPSEANPGPASQRGGANAGSASHPSAADADAVARPSFERPHQVEPPAAAPPTRVVGPRPRPLIPRTPRRRRPGPAVLGIGAGSLVAAAVAGVLWIRPHAAAEQRDRAMSVKPRAEVETLSTRPTEPASGSASAGSTATPRSPAGSSPARTSVEPSRAERSPAKHSGEPSPAKPSGEPSLAARTPAKLRPAERAARTLAALDAMRARAFANRDPRLLAEVYVSGPLLTADTALLRRLVPAGCTLRGVRTDYREIKASGSEVTVTARLPPSQLICADRPRATVPGAGPTRLRLRLAYTAGGVRIAEQALVS